MEPSKQEDKSVPTEGYAWGDEEVASEQLPIEPSSSEPNALDNDQLPIHPSDPNGGDNNPEEELPIK